MKKHLLCAALGLLPPFGGSAQAGDFTTSLALLGRGAPSARATLGYGLAPAHKLFVGAGPTAYGYRDDDGDRQSQNALHTVFGYEHDGTYEGSWSYEFLAFGGGERSRDRTTVSEEVRTIGLLGLEGGLRFPSAMGPVFSAGLGMEVRTPVDGKSNDLHAGERKLHPILAYPYVKLSL